jgi:hypothetical protein
VSAAVQAVLRGAEPRSSRTPLLCPPAQLKRVLPMAAALQPLRMLAAGGSSGGGAVASAAAGPFIFNPYEAKRQEREKAAAAADAGKLLGGCVDVEQPEWVSGRAGWGAGAAGQLPCCCCTWRRARRRQGCCAPPPPPPPAAPTAGVPGRLPH